MNYLQLIKGLLATVQLPKKIAICKCTAHTSNKDPISRENSNTDHAAKIQRGEKTTATQPY